MKLFGKNEIEKDNIKIGVVNHGRIGITDFCLICLSPCYHFNNQDSNTFYIHERCFGYAGSMGDFSSRQFYKDANDVYKKKKDNVSKVLSLREKYKTYVEERNKKLSGAKNGRF